MTRKIVVVLGLAAAAIGPSGALAATTVVTACASDTQQGAGDNLADALARGGAVYFKCPPGTVIHVTKSHQVPGATLIDGEDRMVLDGRGAPVKLIAGYSVVLRRITIRNFRHKVPQPQPPAEEGTVKSIGRVTGSVLNAEHAVLEHLTIESCDSPVMVSGELRVEDSIFRRNEGFVLSGEGPTTIARSTFDANQVGAWIRRGRVHGSTFIGNKTGLFVSSADAAVEINHNRFEANGQGVDLSQRSAPGVTVLVRLRGNSFRKHTAGAIIVHDTVQRARERGGSQQLIEILKRRPPVRFALAYNRFLENAGPQGAAIDADLHADADMTVTGDLFIGNVSAGGGGAIALRGGAMAISHGLFRGNRSAGTGAAVQAIPGSGARLSLANTLIVENVGSGGAIDADSVDLVNVTIASNGSRGLAVRGSATVANAIFSRNKSGNCAGVSAAAFQGGNLQFGAADCPGVAVADPFLDALYVPELGSQALTLGDAEICAAQPVAGADIVFQSRSTRVCALGAFERPPLRHAPERERPRSYPPSETTPPPRNRVEPGTPAYPYVPLASTAGKVPAPEALAKILAAFAADETAAASRSVLKMDVAGVLDVYVIERVKPDRLRVIHNPTQPNVQETVTIGSTLYIRRSTGWNSGPAALAAPGTIPAIDGLLKSGIRDLMKDTAPAAAGVQHYSARMTWSNAGKSSDGRIDIAIDTASARLRTVDFDGNCGTARCRFSQTFSYDALTIATPK